MTKRDQLRLLLSRWGNFWLFNETHDAGGFGRVSPSGRLIERGGVGIQSSGTGYLDSRADTMFVPADLVEIDEAVESLQRQGRVAVRIRYRMMPAELHRLKVAGVCESMRRSMAERACLARSGLSAGMYSRAYARAELQLLSNF